MIAPIAAVLGLLLSTLLSPSLAYTFTPTPHPSSSHTSHRAAGVGRHLTLPLSSHHSLVTLPSPSSTFHPLSRFSPYQLAESNTTGCGAVDFSALLTIDGQGPFRLIVDTGSTTLAVVSSSCTSCDGVHPTYTPTSPPHQSVTSHYGGGTSWSGHSYTASVSLNPTPTTTTLPPPTLIATIDSNSGFINTASCTLGQTSTANISQGIIGFAYPSIAVAGTNSWITNYIANTSIANEFTLQMCTQGGNLWVGDYDPTFLAAPFLYVPILHTDYYSVMLTALTVYTTTTGQSWTPHPLSVPQSALGPCSTPTSNYDCAKVDSGTTQMILPSAAYQAAVSVITGDDYYQSVFTSSGVPGYDILNRGICTQANAAGMPSLAVLQAYLPKLGFTFSTAPSGGSPVGPIILTSIPGYITVSYDATGNPYYCPGIEDGGSAYPLLGYAFMTQFTVRHDLAGQRLGFGLTAQCGVAAPALASYEWVVGGWGACSAACGVGVQWRGVNCTDMYGAQVPDIRCAVVYLSQRPVDSRNCSVQSCTTAMPTTFTSLTSTLTSLTPGLNTTISYAYTGSTPDYVSLYLTSSNPSSPLTFYVTPNASAGTNGAGTHLWTVPSTAPNGTFALAAYAGAGVTMSQAFISSTMVTIGGCTGGGRVGWIHARGVVVGGGSAWWWGEWGFARVWGGTAGRRVRWRLPTECAPCGA